MTPNQYEAMYLFDPTFGASWEDCEAEIKRLMSRAEAELVFCKKWDERRLAFKVKGRKRGVYVLTYFRAAPEKIDPLERDIRLSENVLRALVLRADGITPEMMERAAEARGASLDGEPGGGDEGSRGDGDDSGGEGSFRGDRGGDDRRRRDRDRDRDRDQAREESVASGGSD
ncbi:MAG: 30S ribosomal protein S6 [Phycisphaerae bacterium]|nr:30S ribosomal protein S6 [Phycisphaerae bacterium]